MKETAEQTRARIMAAARTQFRQYGYAKTTMADIGKAAGMSPANVYRFFDTKAALVEAIAALWLGELEAHALAIARRPAPAAERLRAFVVEIHERTRDRFTRESQVHEICAMVANEQWAVVRRHLKAMRAILEIILSDGAEAGELALDDIPGTASLLRDAMVKYHHPTMVAQHFGEPLTEQADALGRLLARAVRARDAWSG